jgi:hypothetical protein
LCPVSEYLVPCSCPIRLSLYRGAWSENRRPYGHLGGDSREHAVSLLDALAVERAVAVGWTSQRKRAKRLTNGDPRPRREAIPEVGGRPVDAETRNRRLARNEKKLDSRNFVKKPSNGLEPLTPSLPSKRRSPREGARGRADVPIWFA